MILLFSKAAASHLAARVHVSQCSVVQAARASKGRVAVIEGIELIKKETASLRERGWPVKVCACVSGYERAVFEKDLVSL